MSISVKLLGSLAIASLAWGCAQTEPPSVAPQPIYNKMGEVIGCEGEDEYNPETQSYENPCDPPEECEDPGGPTTANFPCLPPNRPDDEGQTDPNSPTGG